MKDTHPVSRWQCGRCGDMGHSRRRCKAPIALPERTPERAAWHRGTGPCVDCGAAVDASRCTGCAEIHRLKDGEAGRLLRAARGLTALHCSRCGGERHNRRTCQAVIA